MYIIIKLDKDVLRLAIPSKLNKHLKILNGNQLSKEDF